MPLFIYLKNPSIMLLADDMPEGSTIDQLGEALGGSIKIRLAGKLAILPIRLDCNVAYVKEVSQEELEDFQKKKETEQASRREAGRIARPDMIIPSLKKIGN